MTLRIFTEPQQGATYDELLTVALTAERLGYGAFFRSDHILKMGQATPDAAASENAVDVTPVTDAWITLAGLARDTTTIRLGTMVTPVTFRPIGAMPVSLAQVDHMSGGRIEIGLGTGWFDEEHQAFGLPFPPVGTRMDMLDDQLSILHGVWNAPVASTFSIEGATTSVSIAADSVRPLQSPNPPLILGGGGGPRSCLLAVAYGDEYNVPFRSVEETKGVHDRVRAACDRAGRDHSEIVFSAAQVVCCGRDETEIARRAEAIGRDVEELRKNGLAGTPAEILEKIGTFAEAGVERFYLQLLDLSDLEHLELIADAVQDHAPGR